MRAVTYTRESKGSVESVARQREDALNLADARGLEVAATLGDADKSASGKKARPDFDRLIQLIEAGDIDVIIAWSWDRLERNRRDGLRLIEACMAHGVSISLVRGSDIDMTTPAGRLSADILASVARHEIEAKSDRLLRSLRQSAEAGKPPARRAFGYRRNGTIDPIEGPEVARAFDAVLSGGSIGAVVKRLNGLGLTTTTGREWSQAAVRKLLTNPRYAAIRAFRGVEVRTGTWEPIVTEDVFRAVSDLLSDPSRRTFEGSHARKWLGANLYRCGVCLAAIERPSVPAAAPKEAIERPYVSAVPTVRSGYRISHLAAGPKKIRVYVCRNSAHLVRRADPIDAWVERVVAERLRREDIAALMTVDKPDTAPLRSEAQALRQRMESLSADLSVPEGLAIRRYAALEERLAAVQEALAVAARGSSLAALAQAPDPGQAWLDHPDLAVRQAVVRELWTVVLVPGKPGGRRFDPTMVRFDPPT
jgi:DNA invertase Pin-like site-specific DNA recombinase